jgi:hypothetical protein
MREAICPFCGAGSPRNCDLSDDLGACPWELRRDFDDERSEESSAAGACDAHLGDLRDAYPAAAFLPAAAEPERAP